MEQETRSAFQAALKEALDTYYIGWRSRHSKRKDEELEVDTDTLVAWVEKGQYPQAGGFKKFIKASKFPPDVQAHLLNLYQQLPPRTRQKRNAQVFETKPNPDNHELSQQELQTALPALICVPPFRVALKSKTKLGIALMGLVVILIVLLLALHAQSVVSWCLATAVAVNSSEQQPKVYFLPEVNVHDHDHSEYYIYFEGEYVSAAILSLQGLDATTQQWAFVIDTAWVGRHPNWNTPLLWEVHYRC